GDTRVWVEGRGPVPIRDLVGTRPRIATLHVEGMQHAHPARRVELCEAAQVVMTGVRPVYRLVPRRSLQLRLTPDHRVLTEGRGDIPAIELEPGDRVPMFVATLGDGDRSWRWATVAALEAVGEEEVFDLAEPATRHFFANGLLVHNCGEQPLLPF